MLKPEIQDAFNAQLTREMYSSYLYLSMAAWAEDQGMKGASHWMKAQFLEEQAHALKFFDYLNDRGGRVELGSIERPVREWGSMVDLFEAVLHHEQQVTEHINGLVDLALELSDHASYNFLQWYIAEQVEEEATVGEYLDKFRLVGDDGRALLMLDAELGQRPIPMLDPTNLPV